MYINLYSIFSVKYVSCQDIFYIYIKNKVSKVCIYLYKDNPNTVYLADLYVDNAVRNKGIGTLIMRICDNIAMLLKASKIILFVEKRWVKTWYEKLGYKEIKEFTFPVDNAIWMEKAMKERVYIFDIDGVLADCSHRLHFIQKEPQDWDGFYSNMDKDKAILPNKETLRNLRNALHGYPTKGILFVTGRTEKYRQLTMSWLKENIWGRFGELSSDMLFMRKNNDYRPDYVIKKEIYTEQLKDKYDVIAVFEDRKQVVEMWRELGLTCYQVCEGEY